MKRHSVARPDKSRNIAFSGFKGGNVSGDKGKYPRARGHMVTAGIGIEEASDLTGLSTASIRRIMNGVSVKDTTIAKLLNALNEKFYKRNPPLLDFSREFVPDQAGG